MEHYYDMKLKYKHFYGNVHISIEKVLKNEYNLKTYRFMVGTSPDLLEFAFTEVYNMYVMQGKYIT